MNCSPGLGIHIKKSKNLTQPNPTNIYMDGQSYMVQTQCVFTILNFSLTALFVTVLTRTVVRWMTDKKTPTSLNIKAYLLQMTFNIKLAGIITHFLDIWWSVSTELSPNCFYRIFPNLNLKAVLLSLTLTLMLTKSVLIAKSWFTN